MPMSPRTIEITIKIITGSMETKIIIIITIISIHTLKARVIIFLIIIIKVRRCISRFEISLSMNMPAIYIIFNFMF